MRDPHRAPTLHPAVIVIPALLAAAHVFAADISFTASTGTGIIHGLAREFVYDVYNNQAYNKSELDWELQSLYTANAALAMRGPAGFTASLDVRLGVPWKTGSITDSDWLNVEFNGDRTKTNFSQSDCYTERAILLDAKAGWEFPLASSVSLEPFLAFGFMDFKWTARDGYLQYPPGWFGGSATKPYPDASTQPKIPLSGTVIIYQQTYYIPAVGLSAKFHSGKTSTSISFAFSPLVFCNDVDNHELGGYDYYDYLSKGLFLEPKISMEWQIDSAWLSLDFSYRHIGGLVGNTSQVHTGVGYTPGQVAATYENGAGASYDAVSVSLGFNWTP